MLRMTPTRFRECLALIRWSGRGLADALATDERQVRRWAAGAKIPEPVAAWLDRAAVWHTANPPPARPQS